MAGAFGSSEGVQGWQKVCRIVCRPNLVLKEVPEMPASEISRAGSHGLGSGGCWRGSEEGLARVLRRALGAESDSLWPPHPNKSSARTLEHLIRLLKDAADPMGRRIWVPFSKTRFSILKNSLHYLFQK